MILDRQRLRECRQIGVQHFKSAELTGMVAFEEVVDVDDIERLRDLMKERLLEIAQKYAAEIV